MNSSKQDIPEVIPGHINPHATDIDQYPCVELRAQFTYHSEAKILGNRSGFLALYAAINAALNEEAACVEVFASDGEGYELEVKIVAPMHDAAWENIDGSPYIDRAYCNIEQELADAKARIKELEQAGMREDHEVCQILGKALGYPKAPEGGNEVVTADHVAVTIAQEAAARIEELEARAAFIEHRDSEDLGEHYTRAVMLLTERRAFTKAEIARLLGEQFELIAELEAEHQKLLAVMDFCGEAVVSTAMDGIYQQLTGRIAELEAALREISKLPEWQHDEATDIALTALERARAALGGNQ